MCGDLNLDIIDPNNLESEFINLMFLFLNYSQLFTLPTRVTPTSSRCIDPFCQGRIDSGIISHNVTDHYATFIETPIICTKQLVCIKYHDCSRESIDNLKCKLKEFCDSFSSYS